MNASASVPWGPTSGLNESLGPLQCETDVGVPPEDHAFRFVVHGVLLNAIGLCGLLGNLLSALVLSRPVMRSSVNCLLLGLAGCDTLLIVTSVLLFGLTAVFPYTGRLRHYYYRVCPLLTPVVYPLANAAQTMSVYLTLIVTLERWVAVCHPFRAKALCTSSRARWYVVGTALFALLYNAPKFFEAEVYRVTRGDDFVYCVRAYTAFRNETYVAVYIHWAYLVVMYIVPFGALAALNARIVAQVRRAQAERARLSRVQRRELSLATMLLVVVLVFFLCNLLPLVTNACEAFLGDRFERLDPLVKTGNLLVMINSSVNFLIYVIFGEKFKRVFFKMFRARRCPWRRRAAGRDSPDHTRDDSFASCGERVSLRTTLARNGTSRREDDSRRWVSRRGAARGYGGGPRPPPGPPSLSTELSASAELAPLRTAPGRDARWNGHAQDHF